MGKSVKGIHRQKRFLSRAGESWIENDVQHAVADGHLRRGLSDLDPDFSPLAQKIFNGSHSVRVRDVMKRSVHHEPAILLSIPQRDGAAQ